MRRRGIRPAGESRIGIVLEIGFPTVRLSRRLTFKIIDRAQNDRRTWLSSGLDLRLDHWFNYGTRSRARRMAERIPMRNQRMFSR